MSWYSMPLHAAWWFLVLLLTYLLTYLEWCWTLRVHHHHQEVFHHCCLAPSSCWLTCHDVSQTILVVWVGLVSSMMTPIVHMMHAEQCLLDCTSTLLGQLFMISAVATTSINSHRLGQNPCHDILASSKQGLDSDDVLILCNILM